MENKYRGRAEIRRDWLTAESASDLLCLSGARDGDVGHALAAGNTRLAEQLRRRLVAALPRRLLHRAPARRPSGHRNLPSREAVAIAAARSAGGGDPPDPVHAPETSRPTRPGCASPRATCCPTSAGRISPSSSTSRPGRDAALFADIPSGPREQRRDRPPLLAHGAAGQELPAALPDARGHEPRRLPDPGGQGRPRGALAQLFPDPGRASSSASATKTGSSSRPTPSSRWASRATS